MDQEPLLALHSAGVASHGAVCADDPVARADDQQRVGADRGAQGHDPVSGDAELGGELAVGDRGAVPDGVQGLPDPLLERGAAGGEVEVEDGQLAREVRFELPAVSVNARGSNFQSSGIRGAYRIASSHTRRSSCRNALLHPWFGR